MLLHVFEILFLFILLVVFPWLEILYYLCIHLPAEGHLDYSLLSVFLNQTEHETAHYGG
jgi:hypothetical protein